MRLKVYGDRMSQPSRAVIIFCKVNGIEFEEIKVDFFKRENLSSEFQGDPSLISVYTNHAILRYLASAYPGVPDHWYPTDLFKRAKIDSVLDWHHSNLRYGALTLVQSTALAPALGRQPNPHVIAEAEKILSSSLEMIETIWLKGNGKFLLGNSQPSIADLSLVCEIMQLEVLDEKDCNQILGPHKKVRQWIEDTKHGTRPHFEEIHGILYETKAELQKQRLLGAKNERI